ncbi:MAG TPA: hypothetical protein VGE59_01075 [Patescibacteria group bacterium]
MSLEVQEYLEEVTFIDEQRTRLAHIEPIPSLLLTHLSDVPAELLQERLDWVPTQEEREQLRLRRMLTEYELEPEKFEIGDAICYRLTPGFQEFIDQQSR